MSWFYLILAGMLEIGWPLGLKLAQQEASAGMALPPRLPASPVADTSFTLPKKVFQWVRPTPSGQA